MIPRFPSRGTIATLALAALFVPAGVAAQSGLSPAAGSEPGGPVPASTPTAAAASRGESLEARLQRQEDIEAIRKLLREYGRRLDAGDLQGYADLFAAEGEWVGGFGSVKGRARIAPFMQENMRTPPPSPAAAASGPGPRGVHLLTNEIIDVSGERATAWSKWTYMSRNADNRPFPVMVGQYDDVLVREGGEWKFLRRVVSGDIPYAAPPTK